MPHPKANQPKGTAPARVCFAAFRQDSGASHGYFYAGNRISLQEQNQDTRVVSGPLKEMGKSTAR